MKTLVAYYSHSGNNALLARNLSDVIPKSDLLAIRTTRKRKEFSIFLDLLFNRNPTVDYDPIHWKNYSNLVLCSPVWNYMVAHPMRSFLRREKTNTPKYAFITLCSGREEQQQKLEDQLKGIMEKKPLFVNQLLLSSFLENKPIKALEHPKLLQEDIDRNMDLLKGVAMRLQGMIEQIG